MLPGVCAPAAEHVRHKLTIADALDSAAGFTTNTTTYQLASGVSVTQANGASGTAIVTLSVDASIAGSAANFCVVSFFTNGSAPASDAYAMPTMKGAATSATSLSGASTQVFYLTGLSGTLTYQLYFRSSANGTQCKLNEAAMVVMAP